MEYEKLKRNQHGKLVETNKNADNITVTINQRQTLKVLQQVIECKFNGRKVVRTIGRHLKITYEELETEMYSQYNKY